MCHLVVHPLLASRLSIEILQQFFTLPFYLQWFNLFFLSRWNEHYKKDLFSSRIDTTKALSQAIAASPSPPHSWVLVSGVGKSPAGKPLLSRCEKHDPQTDSWWTLSGFPRWPTACYKPSLTAEYTEDSDWTPFDLLSQLVKEWEAAALLPESAAKTTKQVVIRAGTCKQQDV